MQRTVTLFLTLLLALVLFAACQAEPQVIQVTVPVEQEVIVEQTAVVTATPAAISAGDETAAEPEPTETLPPARATQQALLSLLPTREPAAAGAAGAAIAPDDYVGITEQACRIVQNNYVRDNFNGLDWPAVCEEYAAKAADIDNQEAFWDLMTAMIAELDDNHSRFVPPGRFAAEFSLPSETAGRPWPGFQIWPAREDEQVTLWDVCEVGPAASAGLQRGDVILAINGQPVPRGENGFDRSTIWDMLYGEGNQATLTVQQGPDAAPRDVTLQFGGAGGCDGWRVSLLSETPRIGYIRIPDFGNSSDRLLLQAIEALEEDAPLDGLVLDVRHNPGGNSDSDIAIFTEGTFGKTGPLRADSSQSIYRIRGPVKWNETTPVVVLTDGSSHSAAEYFATAMQQSGRATLIGMPTAGNTEGINSFNLADGSVIRLAWMTLQLPDGSTLEGTGVVPDVEVPLGEWGLRQTPDLQLQAAIDTLMEQIGG